MADDFLFSADDQDAPAEEKSKVSCRLEASLHPQGQRIFADCFPVREVIRWEILIMIGRGENKNE